MCAIAAGALAAPAIAGDGVLIADSFAEFSSTQGGDGWHYGYFSVDGDPASFTELCCFDSGGLQSRWEHSTQPPWHRVWNNGQQPDATCTARRWVAEVTGLVRIDVTSDHFDGQAGARTVRVLNDGVIVYERMFPQGVGGLVTDTVFTPTIIGGVVDFTVSADGDFADDATTLHAEVYRIAVFPPTATAPAVVEVLADPGLCESSFVPPDPAAAANCAGGAIQASGVRGDGLALDDPYPVGITRIDWTLDEPGCPNDPADFTQWIMVRAEGCPDCNGNGQADDCAVQNLTTGDSFLTIQGALNAAAPGDEIVVGHGTYDETIDLLGKPVTLSVSAGIGVTTIDLAGMAATAVTCTSGEGPDTVIHGFHIAGAAQPDSGGGMHVQDASPTITGCFFTGNAAGMHGGGMYVRDGSPAISRCVFDGNSAIRGAGLYLFEGLQVEVSNCRFVNNDGAEGSAMWIGLFDVTADLGVTNCTFSGNTGQLGDGIYILSACEPVIRVSNCILWDQVVADTSCNDAHSYEHNNGVFPSGVNNINADPLFANVGGGDYRLSAGSPCIDAGTNTPLPPGGVDLAGSPRFADDPCVTDTGSGVAPLVDIGAHEFQGSTCDVDGDGSVGIQDFLDLLAAWGPCPDPPDPCPADIDGDGIVGIADLLLLLANWG